MSKKKIGSKIIDVIFIIIVLVIVFKLYGVYKSYNFNSFTKAEYNLGQTEFTRDKEVTYSYDYSYKIESKNYNDAMFYKTISVKPNTPYKLTCMVKTQNVESKEKGAGAQISILDSTECSDYLEGTNDWQKLEFIFDSKNRETIDVGFRLGGNESQCKGTAWFSDFKLEQGVKDNSTNWNVACFIIENLDVKLGDEELKLSMSLSDSETIKNNLERFKNSAKELSNGKMTVDYDIYQIDTPITTVTYSQEFGYYLDPLDVKDVLKEYLKLEEYDYIFVAVRMGQTEKNIEIPVNDWIGLGGMDLYGIGYSNIRLPNSKSSYVYTYNPNINTFPEEVFIHEFLHTLERLSNERGYDIPALHDYNKYNYKEESLIGLKNWYRDYMNCSIKTNNGTLCGLNSMVYTLTPPANSDFRRSIEIDYSREPSNIIEEIGQLFSNISNIFNMK